MDGEPNLVPPRLQIEPNWHVGGRAAIVGSPTAGEAMLSLHTLKRLVDGFDIISDEGRGTTVVITKWQA